MRDFASESIILGHRNSGENDKLIFIYSKEFGKIKALARGSRKITSKFTGQLETLNHCQINFYQSPHRILIKECALISPPMLTKNFSKLTALMQIAEITNKIIFEDQKPDKVFELIIQTVNHIKISRKPSLTGLAYCIKILNLLGLLPDFKKIKVKLDLKYIKFLEFSKISAYELIEKILLKKEEKIILQNLIKKIIEREIEKEVYSFTDLA